jgi:hypothetical protein
MIIHPEHYGTVRGVKGNLEVFNPRKVRFTIPESISQVS